ncbi:hypothetical protein QZH41_013073 [Actinostola sp. cb2023]|nr:hypothetical protein QZH41_013073 [Actinostola sp. cb2023]
MQAVQIPTVVVLIFLRAGSTVESTRIKTEPLRVPYGRSVLVNPRTELVLKYPPRAHCRVDVLRDNPLSERNGFLVPDVFPCDFKHGDVRYTHLGSKFHTQDFVKLQIRVDTKNATEIVPFQLKIFVVFTPMEIVRKNLPVVVPDVGGLSSSIGEDVLNFVYDYESHFCHVALLRFQQPLPRYGDLLNVTVTNSMGARFDCNDFLTSDIRYQHKKLQSSNRDYVPLVIEISDKSLSVIQREHFQIIIRILGARVNERPTASFQASNTLEVKDQALGAVTSSVLAAVDLETKEGEIIFNVSKPLGPGQGQLINLDDPYRPLTAFYQEDVQRLKIAYRPPTIQDGKSRMFQVVLNAIDAEGAISDPILFLIMVKPTNVNAPIVIKNTGLSLFEGQARPLSTVNNLHVADNDNMEDVQIQVLEGLRHGELRIMGHKITTFMATDLDYNIVKYHHDGSETYSDNIVFRMSDETHVVEFVFPITIAPIDDQAPTLMYNTGLVLDEGGLAKIDQYMLSAIDVDSNDLKIQFKVVLPPLVPSPTQLKRPSIGVLCLRRKSIFSDDTGKWIVSHDGFYERNTTRFSQEDIVEGRVFYRHLGGEVFRDRINFLLSDNAVQPNVSPIQTFNILINKVDDLAPKLSPTSSLFIFVNEFSQTTINNNILQYTDDDSKELTYTISKPPFFIDRINSTVEAGYLVLVDSGMKISKFTQLELNHGKIGYQAPDFEIGVLPRHAQFEFSVSDAAGNAQKGQIATVILKPINNKAPKVVVDQLQVDEFSEAVIDKNIITIYDQDTAVHEIRMSITRLPRYGVLLLDSVPMKARDMFTMRDIFASVLKYQHAKIGEASDEAGLVVDDGVHKKVALLEIGEKRIMFDCWAPHLYYRDFVTEEGAELVIDVTLLNAMDGDAPLDELMFHVLQPPKHGVITDTRIEGNVPVSEFTLTQIRKSTSIVYLHDGSETLNDSLRLAVSDGIHNTSQLIPIKILPVDDEEPRLAVNKGMLLQAMGESDLLTRQNLRATDIDSPDENITFILRVAPKAGALQKLGVGGALRNLSRGDEFSQIDITRRLIVYTHDQRIPTSRDEMYFDVSDGTNTLLNQPFYVFIKSDGRIPPTVINRSVRLNQGTKVTITTDFLSAHDLNSVNTKLRYTLTKFPSQGQLEFIDAPGVPVTSFTQLDIASNKLVYVHTSNEEIAGDSFDFEVTDESRTVVITRRFSIALLDVDNKKPVALCSALYVREGRSALVTPFVLRAEDRDTKPESLLFTVTRVPLHGMLLKRGVTIRRFSQSDINAGAISYLHDGTDTTEDSYFLSVSDGTHKEFYLLPNTHQPRSKPFEMHVNITAVDNRPPQMVHNRGVTDLQVFPGGLLGFILDDNTLKAEDRDSNDSTLIYRIERL